MSVLAEIPADEARRRAAEILSSPEYQPPPESWLDGVARWILERLGGLVDATSSAASNPVGAVVLIAVLVGLIGLLLWRYGRVGRQHLLEEEVEPVELEVRRSSDEWATLARRHEGAGEWREGLRCRYRALVSTLIDRGVLRDVPGRTAGEFRIELAETEPALTEPFAAASGLFEDAWYGDAPTGPDDAARFAELADTVQRGAGG